MKGSDLVKMTINIGGELIKVDVPFQQQNEVRDTERNIKSFIDKLKKEWPQNSDRSILAMATFQFAKWAYQLLDIQENAIEITNNKCKQLEEILKENNDSSF